MTRLFPLTITLTMLALTGCGQDSDEMPVDGRDFNGDSYEQPGSYSGVVIDDYLSNARVWLDIDGDYQYTSGEMTVTAPSGGTVVLEHGEPTALTNENGEFTLNVAELDQDPLIASDLDPRDYSLMVMTLPGQTVNETLGGGQVIEQAYLMSAPKGVRTITPLTTLLRFRNIAGLSSQFGESMVLAAAFQDENLLRDYIQAGNERMHAYAKAFVRYLSAQFPADANEMLRNGDGTERVLTGEGAELLAVSFVRNAANIVELVDEAAPFGHYENADIDALPMVVETLDLSNPVVLSEQDVFAYGSNGYMPESFSNLLQSATLYFRYSGEGQLLAIESDGCMEPSLQELARLANAGGYIADTNTQWLPTVSLSQNSREFMEAEGIDERLSFDWDNNRATFITTTTCHDSLTPSATLDGAPAETYQWTLVDGKVSSIGDGELTLQPDYTNEHGAYWGYSLADAGGDIEVVSLTGSLHDCTASIPSEDLNSLRVISHQGDYTFTGYDPQPAAFTDLALDFDKRNGWDRLLRHAFLDPDLEGSLTQDSIRGFQWSYFYQSDTAFISDTQPNLIGDAYLTSFFGQKACGAKDDTRPNQSIFARVTASYGRLSEVLAGTIN